MGFFQNLTKGLRNTRDRLDSAVSSVFSGGDALTEEAFEELEEALILSDLGVRTAQDVVETLRAVSKKERIRTTSELKTALQRIIAKLLEGEPAAEFVTKPVVILVIGVNGVGKTTSIGKLAAHYRALGKNVLLGAADTFRAAAIEQLEIWSSRAQVELVKQHEGADPAAVVFDTLQAAKSRDIDVVICDTAGRLHNKKNLMEELGKIYRVIDRELPYSDREVLLVLDATTGQNALNQAREFKEIAEVTGIVLTKLDGTAKGGVVLGIRNELGIPVKFLGMGEQIQDLQPFDPEAFARALFSDS